MLTDHLHHHGCPGEMAPSVSSFTAKYPGVLGGLNKHCDQLPPFITEQGDLQPPEKHMDFSLHLMLMKQLPQRCLRKTAQLPRPVGLAKAAREALTQYGEEKI